MREIASESSVSCKLSGMVTEATFHSWAYDDFVPYLDVVFDSFAADRLMIGSDWPVCLLSGATGAGVEGVLHDLMAVIRTQAEPEKFTQDEAWQP